MILYVVFSDIIDYKIRGKNGMKKTLIFLLVVATMLPLTACFQSAEAAVIQSDKPRITSPNVSWADETELIEGNSAFAFDLYQALREEKDGNLFYSPYSILIALAMTYAGARVWLIRMTDQSGGVLLNPGNHIRL